MVVSRSQTTAIGCSPIYSTKIDQRPTTDLFMTDQELKPAPLAYQNKPFLNSPDGRILRLLSEYSEPLSRFRREQIQDTVVFFGSARIHSRDNASNRLTAVRGNGAQVSAAEQAKDMKRAEAAVDMARYYE